MTRKCVICKETNYKNSYSFFSAPKDPETRKKWTDAMGIENYVVCDDTYVCSKHFTPSDIITHWVSGVPPHVVTIKYKKCRLRPGAVPNISCESMNNLQNSQDEDYEDFAVNRGTGLMRRPSIVSNVSKGSFVIPREDNGSINSDIDSQLGQTTYEPDAMVECKQENSYTVICAANEECSEDTNNSGIMENPDQEQEMATIVNLQGEGKYVYTASEDGQQIVYVEAVSSENFECMEDEVESEQESKPQISTEYSTIKTQMASAEEDTSMDMWDCLSNENIPADDNDAYPDLNEKSNSQSREMRSSERNDPLNIKSEIQYEDSENAMLFEDLLDIYTEVQLPPGWSSMVTSKGHGTTVVYAFMGMTRTGMPYMEKQVFLKSDMKLRCGAANAELNPQIHNLIREGRSRIVFTLSDVEEFVEEFDQRIVCEGCAGEKTRPEDIENCVAYRDVSSKWRHIECPIIVNNGSARCSKCSTLDSSMTRSKTRRHNAGVKEFASAMMKKEKTIRVLNRLLRKVNKKNQKFETMRDSIENKFESLVSSTPQVFISTVETLNMPKIQKLMIKECVRASVSQTGKSKYSETWVFLCLLLYIESPRMYRYMLLNKYMILPSMRIIRKYLHQIKTDKQFYNLFQRTVEPFQPIERDNEKEPT
ncbi:uncharacterized protein [Venturia canescens]|uniref:uncharacterized protein n=1 Tax=Venturia canescens TaxID=32260 RepID=UPI001C9C9271|nr:uncharacterized protein LOC122405785 [Venturia canescens]